MSDEISRYIVGLDVGTESIRAVVGSVGRDGAVSIIGYNESANSGMRKGVVVTLAGPAAAVDVALAEVERMSGHEVNEAVVNINGSHVLSTKTEGMIAVGAVEHEISALDLARVDEVAATGKIPANREILDLVAHGYALDGQGGIKDPLGMTGSRLEIKASVVSALVPYCQNVRKSTEMAHVRTEKLIVGVVAAARAVLSERQMENGVGVVDMGASTTGVACFEEGDLQYVGVVPMGSNNITNDLAMELKTDPEVAEEIKRRFVSGSFEAGDKDIVVKRGRDELTFKRAEVDEIVEARLEEIFDAVRRELKKAGYDRRLPEGVVLVGGGAKMRDIEVFAKARLELAAKVGAPAGLAGVGAEVEKPEYAVAVGLMLSAIGGKTAAKAAKKGGKGIFGKILASFKGK
jgi:cell division protein FtsA